MVSCYLLTSIFTPRALSTWAVSAKWNNIHFSGNKLFIISDCKVYFTLYWCRASHLLSFSLTTVSRLLSDTGKKKKKLYVCYFERNDYSFFSFSPSGFPWSFMFKLRVCQPDFTLAITLDYVWLAYCDLFRLSLQVPVREHIRTVHVQVQYMFLSIRGRQTHTVQRLDFYYSINDQSCCWIHFLLYVIQVKHKTPLDIVRLGSGREWSIWLLVALFIAVMYPKISPNLRFQ